MHAKRRRQAHIAEIIRSRPVQSQEELARILQAQGVSATQATLSRDFRELSVVKGPFGYRLDEAALRPASSVHEQALARALASLSRPVRSGGSLVILRTGPGEASALAAALDRANLEGVLGTVAGDDTIFVATAGLSAANRISRHLERIARSGPAKT